MRARVRGGRPGRAGVALTALLCTVLSGDVAFAAGPAEAVAQEQKQQCIAASERAQQLRIDGKLVEAQKQLVECAAAACPGAVRADCAAWLTQVNALMPSIVLVARDATGEDLADVTVTMDGQPFATKLDGKALAAGPGEHVFRFERPGVAPASKKVILREGESARKIEVTLGGATATAPDVSTTTEGKTSSGPGVLPWILVGVGGAAVATGLLLYFVPGQNVPPDCTNGRCKNYFDSGTTTMGPNSGPDSAVTDPNTGNKLPCVTNPVLNGCSQSATNRQRQSDAGSADGWKVIGLGTAITGCVIAAGGLVYYFVARPKASAETAPSGSWLLPFVTETTRGAAVGGTF